MKQFMHLFCVGFFALSAHAPSLAANSMVDEESTKTGAELTCRLISVSVGQGSGISVFQREKFERQQCPANFRATDGAGNIYELTALVRAIPNVPASISCGAELDALVGYDIGENGRTKNVEAISGAPKKWVRRSVKAVKKMRFEPYYSDGKATEILNLEITFKGTLEC